MSSSSSNLKLSDVIRYTVHILLWHFHCFSVFVWTGGNVSNTLSVDAYFVENGGKTSPFSKIPGHVNMTLWMENTAPAQRPEMRILDTKHIIHLIHLWDEKYQQRSVVLPLETFIQRDVGLAHNAMYPWNIINVLSTETSKRRTFA